MHVEIINHNLSSETTTIRFNVHFLAGIYFLNSFPKLAKMLKNIQIFLRILYFHGQYPGTLLFIGHGIDEFFTSFTIARTIIYPSLSITSVSKSI